MLYASVHSRALRVAIALAIVAISIALLTVRGTGNSYQTPLNYLWLVGVPVGAALSTIRRNWLRLFGAVLLSAWAFFILVVTNIVMFGASV